MVTAVAATLVLSCGALVSGCGADDAIAERVAEEALEGAASGDADVDIDDGEVKIETDEGTVSFGDDLPDGFPLEEVPLVEGDVVAGSGITGEGWTVGMLVDGSREDSYAQAKERLNDAGFKAAGSEITTEGMSSYTAENDSYQVNVVVMSGDEGTNVNYTVVVLKE